LARQYTTSTSARLANRFLRKDHDFQRELPQSLPADTATNFVDGEEDLALPDTVQDKSTNSSAQKQSKGSSNRAVFENDDHLSDGSDEFHESGNDIIRSSGGGAVPLGQQNDATSRLLRQLILVPWMHLMMSLIVYRISEDRGRANALVSLKAF
jgi:hypothetical protein